MANIKQSKKVASFRPAWLLIIFPLSYISANYFGYLVDVATSQSISQGSNFVSGEYDVYYLGFYYGLFFWFSLVHFALLKDHVRSFLWVLGIFFAISLFLSIQLLVEVLIFTLAGAGLGYLADKLIVSRLRQRKA